MGFLPDLSSMLAFLAMLLGFGFVIFVHELGHFLVAKWAGIRCTQFAVGFGQALLCYRKGIGIRRGSTETEFENRIYDYLKGEGDVKLEGKETRPSFTADQRDRAIKALGLDETEYRVNWMPLGGYVKMVGQDDMDASHRSDDPRSFNNKSVGARMAVISAGVVMNLIFAVIFFIIAFTMGVAFPPAIVGMVSAGGPAAVAQPLDPAITEPGLKPGDKITHLNGSAMEDFLAVRMAVGLSDPRRPMTLTVQRTGKDQPVIFEATPDASDGIPTLGLAPAQSLEVGRPARGSELPAEVLSAGIVPGMKASAVDGKPVTYLHELQQLVSLKQGQPATVTWELPSGGRKDLSMRAEPMLQSSESALPHLLGLQPPVRFHTVLPGSPVAASGVKDGDVLVRLGDLRWPDFASMRKLSEAAAGKPLALSVLRDGKVLDLPPVTPNSSGRLGFAPDLAVQLPVIAGVAEGSPLAPARIPGGSKILAINGHAVADYSDLQRELSNLAKSALASLPPEPAKLESREQNKAAAAEAPQPAVLKFEITYEAGISSKPVTETAAVSLSRSDARALAELRWTVPNVEIFKVLEAPVVAGSPLEAIGMGVRKTHQTMMQTYLTLTRLVQGFVPTRELRGPVGILHTGVQVTRERGFTWLLFLLGLISVNLVVINFLPIPVVDGGHMVFLIIEKLKGSPVSVRVQAIASYAGLALIGSMFLLTLFYDVSRLLVR